MRRKFQIFQKELVLDGVSTHREEYRGCVIIEPKESTVIVHTSKTVYLKYADLQGQYRTELVEHHFEFPWRGMFSLSLHQAIIELFGKEAGYDRSNLRAEEIH